VTGHGALIAAAAEWRDRDPDPVTRTELARLVEQRDIEGLRSRFEGSLTFGTAGIRAELGAGPLRMNRLVVARVAVGLGRHLAGRAPDLGRARVAIGYDGRTNSKVFASDAARVLCRAGCAVSLLPRALPTPVLAFSVRSLRADLGLMVTASHNPRAENGLKLYVADGAQLLPPLDAEIAAAIDAVELSSLPEGWEDGPCAWEIADGVADAYVEAIAGAAPLGPEGSRRGSSSLVVVHTALHGVGTETLRSVLAAGGWPLPHSVPGEADPDPAFPGMPFPNPEEPGVLDGARATAEALHADLVVANDPDADRLAVMVPGPGPGSYERLTGDELGVLLADDVLTRLATADPPDVVGAGEEALSPVVATTVVSGSLLRKMADRAGVRCVTTLTGFKWIVRAAGPAGRLVYGYEEALGYAVRPDVVADKDGISAALRVVELADALQRSGRTLRDHLDDLALRHGLHVTRQRAVRVDGAEGMARLARALEGVRRSPPAELGGARVTVTDLRAAHPGVVDLAGGTAERWPGTPHGPADVLVWHVGDTARVVLRPSGTEPKLKIYVEVASAVEHASELADRRASGNARAEELASAAVDALGVTPAGSPHDPGPPHEPDGAGDRPVTGP